MKITLKSIVGDIVANNYKTAEIFKELNIDFCCGGQKTISEACEKEHVSEEDTMTLLHTLNLFFTEDNKEQEIDYRSWPLDKLTNHIVAKHHVYVEEKIPVLKEYLNKIESAHGDAHPELLEINQIFKDASGQLAIHMKKEEFVLFPYIKKISKAKQENTQIETPPFGSIKNPIASMDEEHEFEGEAFRKIAELSNNYTIPKDGCNTYRVAFGMLKEFEDDLHLHIHKENNILFQRAITLEEELLALN